MPNEERGRSRSASEWKSTKLVWWSDAILLIFAYFTVRFVRVLQALYWPSDVMVDNEVSRREMNAVGRRAAERSLDAALESTRMYSLFAYLSAANANDSWNMFTARSGAAARKNARLANIKTDTDNRHGDTIKRERRRVRRERLRRLKHARQCTKLNWQQRRLRNAIYVRKYQKHVQPQYTILSLPNYGERNENRLFFFGCDGWEPV